LSRSLSPDSLMPPRIDEGHKVFLPGAPGVLESCPPMSTTG